MAGKFWREAASLMVVGRAANLNSKVASGGFEMLLLKRNKNSSFFASTYVFPGGVTEPSDFSEAWLDLFKNCGYKSHDLQKEFRSKAPQPDIYRNKSYHILPEVGFRIGAIRETFEECGLLLAHHFPYNDLDLQQLTKWQKIVHQDGSQFLSMFQELGGCPAIWDLHEWITWLTPSHLNSARFNTAFYITFMDKMPKISVDYKEVVDVKVLPPLEIMKQCHSGSLNLPPPQAYEVGRLLNFDTYEDLERFAHERGKQGMDEYFPVSIITSNGSIMCLPGDDLYPEDPDYTGEQKPTVLQESIEELRKHAKNLHRFELKSWPNAEVVVNISPKYGHIVPAINSIQLLKPKV